MVSPFSIRWPFCLTWKVKGQTVSLWTGNIEKLLFQYFARLKENARPEIYYFASEGREMKLFRGIKYESLLERSSDARKKIKTIEF